MRKDQEEHVIIYTAAKTFPGLMDSPYVLKVAAQEKVSVAEVAARLAVSAADTFVKELKTREEAAKQAERQASAEKYAAWLEGVKQTRFRHQDDGSIWVFYDVVDDAVMLRPEGETYTRREIETSDFGVITLVYDSSGNRVVVDPSKNALTSSSRIFVPADEKRPSASEAIRRLNAEMLAEAQTKKDSVKQVAAVMFGEVGVKSETNKE